MSALEVDTLSVSSPGTHKLPGLVIMNVHANIMTIGKGAWPSLSDRQTYGHIAISLLPRAEQSNCLKYEVGAVTAEQLSHFQNRFIR